MTGKYLDTGINESITVQIKDFEIMFAVTVKCFGLGKQLQE